MNDCDVTWPTHSTFTTHRILNGRAIPVPQSGWGGGMFRGNSKWIPRLASRPPTNPISSRPALAAPPPKAQQSQSAQFLKSPPWLPWHVPPWPIVKSALLCQPSVMFHKRPIMLPLRQRTSHPVSLDRFKPSRGLLEAEIFDQLLCHY